MINPEPYLLLTRALFPPTANITTLGFATHRLKPLITSAVFSPPGQLLQMDAGGSIGTQMSNVESWGQWAGQVDKTIANRSFYRKLYDSNTEPFFRIKELWVVYRTHGVKNPVVHHIYLLRGRVYTLWMYNHTRPRNVAGLDKLMQFYVSKDEFERTCMFDIIAASTTPLHLEDLQQAVRYAHDEEFLRNYVVPALLTAHSQPEPVIRREWTEAPRVIHEVIPISRFV